MRIMNKVSSLATGALLLFVVAVVPASAASPAPNRAAAKQQRQQQPKTAPHPAELSPLEWLMQLARRVVTFGQPSIPVPDDPSLPTVEPMSTPAVVDPPQQLLP